MPKTSDEEKECVINSVPKSRFKVFKDEDNGIHVLKLTESVAKVLSAIQVRAGGCK